MQYNESEFFIETEVPHDEVITSRTDLDGNITYANELFCEISGYSLDELLGKPHSIVRHPDMPKSVYKDLWETIKSGNQWIGIVKNLRKDRGHYWVKAIVSGVYKDGKLVEYKSLRSPIEYHDKLEYQKLYDKIRKDNGEKTRKVIYE
ncbi:MAG: PAS domain-containing protein [Sulfurimonas sp.]|jgi:aerotaxis receptor|uniref:PAS domain-containing protein n=1 Tax=unclassified Sulfurimonas TaxID=2623549 RepID=UPI0008B45803|nr:PAS domain-containing protein [Sulfurimonas sp. RIFOXYB12_FULL_35_9]OHE04501.1 MAG: chemotaxis protein [Sulfurimonas sp. RIFOXYB12_FULL_35_9]OHE08391.1 MAG: chemotaxis protein [Sulfurimonas sp. RIFOXYB2_FULL_37_5]OHE15383.1 MAG: chemotaxis protein [Sulfurimonas sp. RIFOXYD12_FULL_36_11]OHE20797.1 MAG: chemotaxis protein [Sulfurimonas sp. RIFOXYD2_FULL_37_8]